MTLYFIVLSVVGILSAMLPRHSRGSKYGNTLGSLSMFVFVAELTSAIIAFFVAPHWWYGFIAAAIVVLAAPFIGGIFSAILRERTTSIFFVLGVTILCLLLLTPLYLSFFKLL